MIALSSQYHLIRVLENDPSLFLLLVSNKEQSNLAMARYKLALITRNPTIWGAAACSR